MGIPYKSYTSTRAARRSSATSCSRWWSHGICSRLSCIFKRLLSRWFRYTSLSYILDSAFATLLSIADTIFISCILKCTFSGFKSFINLLFSGLFFCIDQTLVLIDRISLTLSCIFKRLLSRVFPQGLCCCNKILRKSRYKSLKRSSCSIWNNCGNSSKILCTYLSVYILRLTKDGLPILSNLGLCNNMISSSMHIIMI
ncbi:Uncharacterised protein [Streptococcus pneumoniae]|nr:Uncharacterised protein [Streptococcus pneumoniae]